MPQEMECIPNYPVNITDFYSIGRKLAEKSKFVDLWEGCMMGLPRLQPDKLCMDNDPGGRLNKKDGLTRYGDSHVKDKTS